MKLLSGLTLSLLGLTCGQFVESTGASDFLSDVNSVLAQIESGEVTVGAGGGNMARMRGAGGVPDPILAQFAGRKLPPGIQLSDFAGGPNGFRTQAFLKALQAALRKQAEQQRLRQQQLLAQRQREAAAKAAAEKAAREAAAAKAEEEAKRKAAEEAAQREAEALKKAQEEAAKAKAEAEAKAKAEAEAKAAAEAAKEAELAKKAAAEAARKRAEAEAAKQAAEREQARQEALRQQAAIRAREQAAQEAAEQAAREQAEAAAIDAAMQESASSVTDSFASFMTDEEFFGNQARPNTQGNSDGFVASSNGSAGRPNVSSTASAGLRDFMGINSGTGLATERFNTCRVCDKMTAAECANAPRVACYPTQDMETDDRVCMLTYHQRRSKTGTFETLYTSQCVIQSTCEAAVRQNFVFGTTSANAKFNQCKKKSALTLRESTSECSFCQKLGHETGLGNTDIFDDATQPFEGITEDTLTADPGAQGLWTEGTPLGQLFASGTYTYTV